MALPARISVEDSFNPPDNAGATASPDGTRIAYLAPWKNRLNVLPELARPHVANNWHVFVDNPDVPEELADMQARSPITKVEALRARGVDVEYMVKDDAGHGFVNPENTIDMFQAVERRFLAQHLGGRR